MTTLLYNESAYTKTFTAVVLSCEQTQDGFHIILDRTAFFPEGGGQGCDTGTLDGIAVNDVQLRDGCVIHTLPSPLTPSKTVTGVIDWDARFDRMQNHTGEHILSGILHNTYGYDNVGFHLGDTQMTLDTSGELTEAQIADLEIAANRAVYENLPVTVTYPDADALAALSYRAKLELTENVRIVTIGDIDVCACCAPHVAYTGEIGCIRIIGAIRWKGGMRLTVVCGARALADTRMRAGALSRISTALSAKPEETYDAFCRVQNTVAEQKQEIVRLRRELLSIRLETIAPTEGSLCLFLPDADQDSMRLALNTCVGRCGLICGVFSGNDADGYRFVIGAQSLPLRSRAKEITSALDGRGGGSDQMISGTAKASEKTIRAYFDTFTA